MIISERINKTNFFFVDSYNSTALGEYYNMICNQLKKIFNEISFPYDVNFGAQEIKKDINLDFQYEHTIVKKNDSYQHNIHRYDYLSKLDCVFEYTETNIKFLSTFVELSEYVKKNIYIPPLIYQDTPFSDTNLRILDFTTLQSWSKRRAEFYNKKKHNNIDGSFDKIYLRENLDKFKILLNIHQIEEHRSFEELRVLPALSTGILVISENVPFEESIPYSKHIIWTPYEKIEETLDNVLNNYEYYRTEKLTELSNTLQEIKETSYNKILKFFKNI